MLSINKFIGSISFSLVFLSVGLQAYGNNFSCNYGKQGACLDYGDKVCSSYSKCVKDNAICFDSYTCGYQGFVCKSKFQDLADEYDRLVEKYNILVRKKVTIQHPKNNKPKPPIFTTIIAQKFPSKKHL